MPEESPSRDVLNGFAHPTVGGNLIRSVKMGNGLEKRPSKKRKRWKP